MFSKLTNHETFPLRGNKQAMFFQAKLSINQPNDVYEQEANNVAEQVMRMHAPSSEVAFFSPVSVQRKCRECEEEEKNKVQRKESNNLVAASTQTENYVSSV